VVNGAGRAVVVAAGAIALFVGACGSSGSGKSTGDIGTAVQARLLAAKTFRVHITSRASGKPALGFPVPGSGSGAVDYVHDRASITMRSSVDDLVKTGRSIVDGPNAYLQLSGSLNYSRRHWIEYVGATAAPADDPARVYYNDPIGMVRALRVNAHRLTLVGRETVGGVETNHYRAIVPESLYADQPDEIDAWVDARSLLRRISTTWRVALPIAKPAAYVVSVDLVDFGAPVQLPLPAPRDVQVVDVHRQVSGVTPSGPWQRVASGRSGGVNIDVRSVRAGVDEVCVSVTVNPALAEVAIQETRRWEDTRWGIGPAAISYNGRRANCVLDPDATDALPDGSPIDPFQLVDQDFRQLGGGTHYFAALVARSASNLVANLSDGTRVPLANQAGVVFAVWQGKRRLDDVELTAPSAALDRPQRYRCGAHGDDPIADDAGGYTCVNEPVGATP
jgi:hypothetical protein